MGKRLTRFRRTFSFLLAIIMVLSMTVISFGNDFSIESLYDNLDKMDLEVKLEGAVVLMLNSPIAFDDLAEVSIDSSNNNIKPLLKDNKTLVPVRFISESLDAKVDWNAETSIVTIKLGNRVAELAIGSNKMKINGAYVTIDVPAQLISGKTFVPLRAIAEALGKEVFYDRGLIIISDTKDIFDVSSEKGYIDAIISMFTGKVPEGYDYDYYYTIAELFNYAYLEEYAMKYADKLIEMRPNSSDYYTKLQHAYEYKADLLRYLEKYDEALSYYDKAIEIDPSNDYLYFSKGMVLYEIGEYEKSIEMFNKSIALDPSWPRYYDAKISSLVELEKYDEVVRVYNKLIELNMNEGAWIYEWALDMWDLGLEEEAAKLFDKAISKNPNNIGLYEFKGVFLCLTGEYEKSIEVFDYILTKNNKSMTANLYKYLALWQLGEYTEAVAFLENAVEMMPDYAKELCDAAKTLKFEGRYYEALNLVDLSIRLNNKYAPAYDLKANLLWLMGRLEESVQSMNIAIELDPKNIDYHNNLAWVLLESGQYKKALEHVNTAIELSGDTVGLYILDTRAWVLYELGQYDKAMEDFSIVIEGDSTMDSALYGMACIYAHKNENDKAIEYLSKTFKVSPSYAERAKNDDAFKNIKNTPEFKELVNRYTR